MSLDPEPEATTRILFIANGHGEDSIAAAIAARLPDTMLAHAYPVVGAGSAYDGICEIVGPRTHIPSEGWRHTSGSVMRDVKGGMLSGILPAIRFLHSLKGRYDKIVTVGDAVTPLLCLLAGLRIDIYLDVFKSGYAHHYSFVERWLIRKIAKKVYCRDDMLASALRASGVNAFSAGNIMLDTIPCGKFEVAKKRKRACAITLLPGSRVWTGQSLKLQVEALRHLPEAMRPDVFVAVAGGVNIDDLAQETGLIHKTSRSRNPADLGQLVGDGLTLHLATGVVGNLIEASDLVLSQAGTATQQALGMGKPVITFNRADNRPKRMADEQALMGEARILTKPDAKEISEAIIFLLSKRQERLRLGEIGRERLGGPGTMDAVIADLVG